MKIPAPAFILLAASFVFCGCHSRIEHGWEIVLSVGTNQNSQIDANAMKRVVKTLEKRLAFVGCPTSVEQAGDDRVSIKLDPNSKEQIEAVRSLATRSGSLQFRLVHENNTKLIEDGLVPPGYQLLKERRRRIAGEEPMFVPYTVSKMNVAGLGSKNLSQVGIGRDAFDHAEILFSLDPEGTAAFERVTSENIGRTLAIVLDGEIYSVPIIKAAIPGGHAVISGSFSIEEVNQVVTILRNPLEVKLQIQDERKF